MAEFKRNRGENFESFLRRFNKSLIASKKLKLVRKKRYLNPKINKRKQKNLALNNLKIKKEKEYLVKIGKIKEDTKSKW